MLVGSPKYLLGLIGLYLPLYVFTGYKMPTINIGNDGADGPLASLELNTKYDTTYFPNDLADTPYFIIFRAQKEYKFSQLADVKVNYAESRKADDFVGPGERKDGFVNTIKEGVRIVGGFAKALQSIGIDITQPAHSFALPIPSNLNTSYNAQYNNNAELGVAGQAARNVAAGMGNKTGSFTQNLVDSVKESEVLGVENISGMMKNLGIAAAGADTLTTALAGALVGGSLGATVGAALGSIGTGALRGLGVARNPHLANVFTGVNFRQHTFQYKLIAKNEKESEAIRDLIRNFKYHMAPDYRASDHVFLYPSKFQIILRAGDYLFKIGDSVLTTFDVNYTGEGAPYFFEDTNAPYSVTINMTFVEDTIVTKREIRQGR